MMSDPLQKPLMSYICQLHAEGGFSAMKASYFVSVPCFIHAIHNGP